MKTQNKVLSLLNKNSKKNGYRVKLLEESKLDEIAAEYELEINGELTYQNYDLLKLFRSEKVNNQITRLFQFVTKNNELIVLRAYYEDMNECSCIGYALETGFVKERL